MSAQPQSDIAVEVREFMKLVAETGRPDEWPRLRKAKPPQDTNFMIWKFIIPVKFRRNVPKAYCAVCSLTGPKYWVGYLVRFYHNECYYVVGHTCGEQWLGETFTAQANSIAADEADERAMDFLVENGAAISGLRTIAQETLARAKEIDEIRANLFRNVGLGTIKRLLREAPDGLLIATESQLVSIVGTNGRAGTRVDYRVVEKYLVSGLKFLRGQKSAMAAVLACIRALAELPPDGEEALDTILEWQAVRGVCAKARLRLYDAQKNLAEAFDLIRLAGDFFSAPNFARIGQWAAHPSCSLPIRAGVDRFGRLSMTTQGAKSIFQCEMRGCLTSPLPTLPGLVERRLEV
jgi:hypothetical protein